jgi:hypothetical protein
LHGDRAILPPTLSERIYNRIDEALEKQIADEKDAGRRNTPQQQLAVAQQGWEELKEIRPTPPGIA